MDDFEINFSNFGEFRQSSKKVDFNRKLFLDYCVEYWNLSRKIIFLFLRLPVILYF